MDLLLVFQLSTNDMVRLGDWISMPKYGADGDVTEINLTTIKVQNFDKTITTIPTYALISDSFKNWRGMEESEGRRIKRSLNITMNSVRFCDEKMLKKFEKYSLLTEYLKTKEAEVEKYNTEHNVNKNELINGRHLTNIGVFRAYLQEYVNSNPNINLNLTCMVRQLPATEKGLPIEIYAFSKDKEWGNFEAIVANIFDHIYASVPSFELEIFQNPSGSDFKNSFTTKK